MANEFYNPSGNPQNSGPGRSIDIRSELIAISAAFDKLLALSGSPSQLVGVNAAGNALEAKGLITSGNWTPVFDFDTHGDLNIVYSQQIGKFVRLGPFVIVFFNLEMSTFTFTTSAGGAKITGLTIPNVISLGIGAAHFTNLTFAGLHVTPYLQVGSVIQFIGATSGATDTAIGVTHFLSGSSKRIWGFAAYMA